MPFPSDDVFPGDGSGGGTFATLGTLRSDVRDLAGLTKATPDQVDALINEGDAELCVRSEWTRANLSLGSTVAGQAAYDIPTDDPRLYRILKLKVNGIAFLPASENVVDRIVSSTGDLALATDGVFWLSFEESGVEQVSIYPTPGSTTAGLPIVALSVVYPTPMVADDDPTGAPRDFARGIRDYVAAKLYGYKEDNADLRAFHEQQFEDQVARLRGHRMMRGGRGQVRMAIEGVVR